MAGCAKQVLQSLYQLTTIASERNLHRLAAPEALLRPFAVHSHVRAKRKRCIFNQNESPNVGTGTGAQVQGAEGLPQPRTRLQPLLSAVRRSPQAQQTPPCPKSALKPTEKPKGWNSDKNRTRAAASSVVGTNTLLAWI